MTRTQAADSSATSMATFLADNAHAYSRDALVRRWSRRQLDSGLHSGSLTRLLPGVYCGAAHAGAIAVRAEGLALWHPAGAVTGAAALHLYAPVLPAPRHVDFIVPHGQRLQAPPWARLHQTGPIAGRVLAREVDCVPMPRAAVDAWRYAPSHERRELLWTALWEKVCTWRQLHRELRGMSRVAGRRDLERVLSWFADGATSPLEVRARYETFADRRFRDFRWQSETTVLGRRVRIDMEHREAMVAVEFEGDRYHSTRDARDWDRERQIDLVAAGYVVMRLGWKDITRRPGWCRDRVWRVVEARLGAPSPRAPGLAAPAPRAP